MIIISNLNRIILENLFNNINTNVKLCVEWKIVIIKNIFY